MAEITRKSVLLECLSIMREEQRICSKGYNSLEPAKGMEEAWEQGRQKIKILQEIIQALDSEPVLRAMANWQKEEMPPKEINSAFDIPQTEIQTTPEKIVMVKASREFEDLLNKLQGKPSTDRMDTEDGTMELR